VNTPVPQMLHEGIAAAKAGQREAARSLLARVTEEAPENITAWLWLSGVMESPLEQERCLRQVLALEPEHAVAKRGLAALQPRITDDLLMRGIAAAEIGKKAQARSLLLQVTERDEENVLAWLWLSRVVESVEDQQLCLENVLALDPAHSEARIGLAALQQQNHPEPPLSPVALIEAELPPSTEELAWQDAWKRYDAIYACPTCAALTQPEDKRCAVCGNSLWTKSQQREKPSMLYWILWAMQAINVLSALAAPVLWVFQVSQSLGIRDYTLLLPLYFGGKSSLPAEAISVILQQAPRWQFFITWIPAVLALGLLIGITLRWAPVYYFLLVNAILSVLLVLAAGFLMEGPLKWVSTGCGFIVAVVILLLTLNLQSDFIKKQKRLLLHVDRGITEGVDFLARGTRYMEQGRWALAALHLRRAAAQLQGKPAPQAMLVRACLHLEDLTLAAQALENLRRMSPHFPELKELEEAFREVQERHTHPETPPAPAA